MIHRGSKARESKQLRREMRMSTLEEKYRRHKNKQRIWRRAVKRLAASLIHETPTAAPIGAAVA